MNKTYHHESYLYTNIICVLNDVYIKENKMNGQVIALSVGLGTLGCNYFIFPDSLEFVVHRVTLVVVNLGGVDLILVFHHLAQLPRRFCHIHISPDRIGQRGEHSKSKSTQPSPRADGTPCG